MDLDVEWCSPHDSLLGFVVHLGVGDHHVLPLLGFERVSRGHWLFLDVAVSDLVVSAKEGIGLVLLLSVLLELHYHFVVLPLFDDFVTFLVLGAAGAVGPRASTVLQRLLHYHRGELEQIRFVAAEWTMRDQLLLEQLDGLDVLALLHELNVLLLVYEIHQELLLLGRQLRGDLIKDADALPSTLQARMRDDLFAEQLFIVSV